MRVNGVVAQMARASALQAEGRGFESHLLHLWDRAEVAYQAHNLEVGGSNPPPATIFAAFEYRLVRQLFTLKRGVRLPYRLLP